MIAARIRSGHSASLKAASTLSNKIGASVTMAKTPLGMRLTTPIAIFVKQGSHHTGR